MSNSDFEEKYKALNEKQKEAVDTIEGPVMVVAGPGTGKTTVLTLRIANILRETDTPASAILAITFTEAGVVSMRRKLREIIGALADEVHIHTFHGFAGAMINDYPEHFPRVSDTEQLSDIEAEAIIREIVSEPKYSDLRPLGKPDLYVRPIIASISDSKREARTPSDLRAFAEAEKEQIEQDGNSISTSGKSKGGLKADARKRIEKCEKTVLLADVYAEYEERKRKNRKMDFDDLIFEFLSALERDELLLRLVQERFLYILVDEHQDTNDAQNRIIYKLADFFDNPNLFIVGDDKQAIYRFQGASVENFMRLRDVWKDMRLIQLEKNYRSHQSILDASFGMIESNYEGGAQADLRVRLSAGLKLAPRPVEVAGAASTLDMERYLVDRIKQVIADDPEASVAVITKQNRDVERVLRLALAAGADASAERSIDIFAHPVGRFFFELIEFLNDPSRMDALAKTFAGGLWRLSFAESARLIGELKAARTAEAEKAVPGVRVLRTRVGEDGAMEFLFELADVSGLGEMAARSPANAEVWRGIVSLAESLCRERKISDPQKLFEELLAYRDSAKTRNVKVKAGSREAPVKVMTAHSSKGLEYDYVFIPYSSEETWVGRERSKFFVLPQRSDEGEHVRDARRLFYVALTRARKHAAVLFGAEEPGGRELSEVRFVEELDAEHIERTDIPSERDARHPLERRSEGMAKTKEFAEYAKTVLADRGLSVTALNHYLECPSKFWFLSILKLPEPPAAPAVKGSALHAAIESVWRSKETDPGKIETLAKRRIDEYLDTVVMPAAEKESLRKEVFGYFPALSSELAEHVSAHKDKNVRVEMWSARAFKPGAADAETEIPLHGKLDAVVEDGDTLLVFDYKSREAMSENALRGETKSNDGSYFRQLVFYRMLLANDARFKGKNILPALMFVKPDDKGRCKVLTTSITAADISGVEDEIRELAKDVESGEFLQKNCDDEKCEWCKLKENLTL